MLFNSFSFLALFLATFVAYYIPAFRKIQVFILVCASLIFYAWDSPHLLILLLASIFINSTISYQIARSPKSRQVFWAVAGIIINLKLFWVLCSIGKTRLDQGKIKQSTGQIGRASCRERV